MNLKTDSKMNDLITREERPMTINPKRLNELLEVEENFHSKLQRLVKMETASLEEYNKMLEGNLQLHRVFTIMLMAIVFALSIGLFAITYNNVQ